MPFNHSVAKKAQSHISSEKTLPLSSLGNGNINSEFQLAAFRISSVRVTPKFDTFEVEAPQIDHILLLD